MGRKTVEIFRDQDFGIVHDIDDPPNRIISPLHNHDDLYEIILFLNGDCEFSVEGNTYQLQVHDIVFTRPFEMHTMMCLTEKTYERLVLFIKSSYFKNNLCEPFRDVFENRPLGAGNCISKSIAGHTLRDCMHRLYWYSEKQAYDVAKHIVYELLYLFNEHKQAREQKIAVLKDERVRNIILFINSHLSEKLSLDMLAKKFFLSKNAMCRIFKANTGYTISNYINYKRILMVQELHRNGQTLTQASLNAGFNSYANFYKTYVNQIGDSPNKMN